MKSSTGVGGRPALDNDGRPRVVSVLALSLSVFPPFLGIYAGQTWAATYVGEYFLNSLLTLLGGLIGALVSVVLIICSGVLADIKAHEMWLAMVRLYQQGEGGGPGGGERGR